MYRLLWFDVGVKRYTTSCIRTTLTNLFNKSKATICEYSFYIFKEEELEEKVVCRKFRQTTQYGALEGKTQSKEVKCCNLDVIISVGYRVKNDSKVHVPSPPATAFVSLCHCIRLLQPSDSIPSATAFDSISHHSRLIRLMHSTPSAIAVVSFSHRSRLIQPNQPYVLTL